VKTKLSAKLATPYKIKQFYELNVLLTNDWPNLFDQTLTCFFVISSLDSMPNSHRLTETLFLSLLPNKEEEQ
jgi:hypothetical protein